MARTDGFALCRSLHQRAMASGCDGPVFIVTAAYVSAAAKMAAEAGAVALLKKPFDLEGFMKDLERYCGGRIADSSAVGSGNIERQDERLMLAEPNISEPEGGAQGRHAGFRCGARQS